MPSNLISGIGHRAQFKCALALVGVLVLEVSTSGCAGSPHLERLRDRAKPEAFFTVGFLTQQVKGCLATFKIGCSLSHIGSQSIVSISNSKAITQKGSFLRPALDKTAPSPLRREKIVRDFIPGYIREHILNAKPPDGCCVPEGSIPAIAEGHFTSARVATVGINPHGSWNRKDFFPKEWLTLDRYDLDEQFLNRVWEKKTQYFERKTYRYFTVLEPILKACGATYGGRYGTDRPDLACSLDLVQWPTDPLWRKLPMDAQSKLLSDGAAFFEEFLQENENIKLLLGNGKTVVEQLERTFKVRFDKWKVDDLGVHIYCGALMGKRFIGWSAFLSNSPMNRFQKAELARLVGELRREGCP